MVHGDKNAVKLFNKSRATLGGVTCPNPIKWKNYALVPLKFGKL